MIFDELDEINLFFEDFSETVIFYLPEVLAVNAIVDNNYLEQDQVSAQTVKITVPTEMIEKVKIGDICKVRDIQFRVCTEPQADGTGISYLILEKTLSK